MRDIRSLPIALTVLLLAGGAVSAAPGLATTDVNVRQGPGMNFPVVTTIRGGSNLDVQSCNTGWCAVRFGPYAGFVKATYLDFSVASGPRYYRSAPTPFLYGPPPRRYWGPRPYWGPGPYSAYGYGWRRGYWGW